MYLKNTLISYQIIGERLVILKKKLFSFVILFLFYSISRGENNTGFWKQIGKTCTFPFYALNKSLNGFEDRHNFGRNCIKIPTVIAMTGLCFYLIDKYSYYARKKEIENMPNAELLLNAKRNVDEINDQFNPILEILHKLENRENTVQEKNILKSELREQISLIFNSFIVCLNQVVNAIEILNIEKNNLSNRLESLFFSFKKDILFSSPRNYENEQSEIRQYEETTKNISSLLISLRALHSYIISTSEYKDEVRHLNATTNQNLILAHQLAYFPRR